MGRVPGFGRQKGRSGSPGGSACFPGGRGCLRRRAAIAQRSRVPGPQRRSLRAPGGLQMERAGPSRGGGWGALRPCFVCLAFRSHLACPGAEVSRLLERPPVRLGVGPTGSQETGLFPRCHLPKGPWRPLAPRSPWLRQSGGGYRRLLAWPQLLVPLIATLVLEGGGKTPPSAPHTPKRLCGVRGCPCWSLPGAPSGTFQTIGSAVSLLGILLGECASPGAGLSWDGRGAEIKTKPVGLFAVDHSAPASMKNAIRSNVNCRRQ